MSDMILRVEGLTKKYDKFCLDNIGLNIPKGYIMGFVGQNGAGKSTTIKCIMNLISYDKGIVEIMGMDNRRYTNEIRNRIGYVSEEPYFYEGMTVEWNGGFIGSFYSNWDKKLFNEFSTKFKIDRSKKVSELSKGMKMKLSLAVAMAHKPELMILDEPTSGLDPVVRSELLDTFLDIIQNENCSIFFSSHITSDIEKVADFVTIIDNGRIILSDEKDRILNGWRLIKAESNYFSENVCRNLVGVKKGEFGFSGVTNQLDKFALSFKEFYPQGSFRHEKVTLDELLVRFVKDGENCA